jgi:hypothetical protein
MPTRHQSRPLARGSMAHALLEAVCTHVRRIVILWSRTIFHHPSIRPRHRPIHGGAVLRRPLNPCHRCMSSHSNRLYTCQRHRWVSKRASYPDWWSAEARPRPEADLWWSLPPMSNRCTTGCSTHWFDARDIFPMSELIAQAIHCRHRRGVNESKSSGIHFSLSSPFPPCSAPLSLWMAPDGSVHRSQRGRVGFRFYTHTWMKFEHGSRSWTPPYHGVCCTRDARELGDDNGVPCVGDRARVAKRWAPPGGGSVCGWAGTSGVAKVGHAWEFGLAGLARFHLSFFLLFIPFLFYFLFESNFK